MNNLNVFALNIYADIDQFVLKVLLLTITIVPNIYKKNYTWWILPNNIIFFMYFHSYF